MAGSPPDFTKKMLARDRQINSGVPPAGDLKHKTQDAAVSHGSSALQTTPMSHSHPELAGECVVFVDDSRRYVDCSDDACQLLGHTREEMLQKTIDEVSYNLENVPAIFEEFRKSGEMEGEYILVHKNGRPVFIHYRARVFPDGCLAAVWDPIPKWRERYFEALLELDPIKLAERIETAEAAMRERSGELILQHAQDSEEQHAISDALSRLAKLKQP